LVGSFSNERAQPFPSLLYILAFGARSREEKSIGRIVKAWSSNIAFYTLLLFCISETGVKRKKLIHR
jgi:hypothetical protein